MAVFQVQALSDVDFKSTYVFGGTSFFVDRYRCGDDDCVSSRKLLINVFACFAAVLRFIFIAFALIFY